MKKMMILVAAATTMIGFRSAAQPVVSKVLPKFDLGVKAGVNFDKLTGVQNSSSTGFAGGLFADVRKSKSGLRVEALISSAKYTFSVAASSPEFSNTYFDIPVLYEHKIVKILWLQVGPQFRSLLSVSETPAYSGSSDPKSDFSSFSVGALFGLEAQLPKHLIAGARYIYTVNTYSGPILSGASVVGAANENSHVIQLYAGYKFL
jgi:hypothetical protein